MYLAVDHESGLLHEFELRCYDQVGYFTLLRVNFISKFTGHLLFYPLRQLTLRCTTVLV